MSPAPTTSTRAPTSEGRRRRPAAGGLLADEERDAPLGGEHRRHRPLGRRRRVRAAGVAQQHPVGQPADEPLGAGAQQLHQLQPGQRREEPVRGRRPRRCAAPTPARARRRPVGGAVLGVHPVRPDPRRQRLHRRADGASTAPGRGGARRARGSGAARSADCRPGAPRAHVLWTGAASGRECGPPGCSPSWPPAVLLSGCGDDGYHPAGPFRPLPEGAPPEVGPPTSAGARCPATRPSRESGGSGGRPERRRARPGRADRAGGPGRRQRDRRRARDRPAAAGLPRPVARPRADDRPGRRHHRRRRPARPRPLAHLRRGRPALRLPVDGDRQPGGPLPAGRHARTRSSPASRAAPPHNGGGLLFGADGTCSSAPATPATRRWPPTRTRWPARCCRSTSSATRSAAPRSSAAGTAT